MKQTKKEAYLEFISDLRNIENNIELNTANKHQYIKLSELYKMVGIDEQKLLILLESAGVKNLPEFFENRKNLEKEESPKVNFFISTIKGINNAIEKKLTSDLEDNS